MNISSRNVRILRWAVPVAAAAVAGTLAATGVFSTSASPAAAGPADSNARLVAAISSPHLPPLTGTLRITDGRHAAQTVQVWLGRGGRARLHAEGLDVALDGHGAQIFSARDHTAVRVPAAAAPALDPQRALRGLLEGVSGRLDKKIGVTVAGETTVAGRRARVVELAPKDGGAPTVRVSLDEATHLPLAAEGSGSAHGRGKFTVAFTRLHVGAPAASALRPKIPAGTTVRTASSAVGGELVADAARLLADATGR
jgi:hypothetical protein